MQPQTGALEQHRERVRRARTLAEKREDLSRQIAKVRAHYDALRAEMAVGEQRADKLGRASFASLVAGLTRKREEKLGQGLVQAQIARNRLAMAGSQLAQLEEELAKIQQSEHELMLAEEEYARVLAAKEDAVLHSGSPVAAELAEVQRMIAYVDASLQAHIAARDTGVAAGKAVHAVLGSMEAARIASSMGRVTGTVGEVVEFKKLRQAEGLAWNAQQAVDQFCAALRTIGIPADMKLPNFNSLGFAMDRVADLFVKNNSSMDHIQHDEILDLGGKVQDVAYWVRTKIQTLHAKCEALEVRGAQLAEWRIRILGEEFRV